MNTSVRIHTLVARRWWQRARGLIARPQPRAGAGMYFPHTWSVHGMGMAHALDLVFLDARMQVLRCCRLPVLGVRSCWRAHGVLEMRCGEIARLGIRPGMQLQLDEVADIFCGMPEAARPAL